MGTDAHWGLARPVFVSLAHANLVSPQDKAIPTEIRSLGALSSAASLDPAILHPWRLPTINQTWSTCRDMLTVASYLSFLQVLAGVFSLRLQVGAVPVHLPLFVHLLQDTPTSVNPRLHL